MYDGSKLLPKSQFQQLLKLLPSPKQKQEGRRRVSKEALLTGILQVLVNGAAWKKIAASGCSYASSFRYLQELQRRGKLKLIFKRLATEKTDLTSCAIDTTLVTSFEFARQGQDGAENIEVLEQRFHYFVERMGCQQMYNLEKDRTMTKYSCKTICKTWLENEKKF